MAEDLLRDPAATDRQAWTHPALVAASERLPPPPTDGWEPATLHTGDSFYVPKPSVDEQNAGLDGLPRTTVTKFGPAVIPRQNTHPTPKPVKLMRLLVARACRPGGVVLDPFAGSGTTGMACAYEGRAFIGLERQPAYLAIAARRIAYAQRLART